MKKRLLYGITLVLTIISLVCIFAFSASAAGEKTPSVSIDKFNLVFDDNVYLKYAVKFDNVAESAINEIGRAHV